MSNPTISVVMAMYNARPYVAEAIDSVLRQDDGHFELLVIDDGSTDGGHEIVERFQDPRIRLTRTQNRGLSAARNLGIAQSQGIYVTFLDSDDLLTSNSLSSRLAGFEKTGVDCVFSRNVIVVDLFARTRVESLLSPHCAHKPAQPWPAESLIEKFIDRQFYVFSQAFLVPRELLRVIDGFDENIRVAVDVEFFTRLLLACHTLVETFEPYYVYRRLPNSLSAINSCRKAGELLRALRQSHRNLAPYLSGREASVAQTLFDVCVQVYPYWTSEHRLAMAEARRLRGDEPFELAGVGGPRAQAVARLVGWRAGRLTTMASSMVRQSLRRARARGPSEKRG